MSSRYENFSTEDGRKERDKIQEELGKYSGSIIAEFEKLFPLPLVYHEPGTPLGGIYGERNYYSQNIIPKEGKDQMVNLIMLYENPYGTFWSRWVRFKKLKAFL